MHAATAHVAADQISGRSDLVDLIDVNDSELRQVQVAIGFVHELANQIFNVAADVTRLAELRRVRLYEGNFDQLGNVLDQVRFADAGRADQDDILLDVFNLLGTRGIFPFKPAQIVGVVVMIANRDRENLFRLLLFYDEPVEVRLDIPRKQVEFEILLVALFRLFILFRGGLFRLSKGRH